MSGSNLTGGTGSSYSATTGGSYTVYVSDANNCTATSSAVIVTVNSLPTSTVTPATNTTFCIGGSVILNANTGAGYNYQWKKNGILISGSTLSSYTANTTGVYSVQITDANGCSNTSIGETVTVNSNPVAIIGNIGSTTFCQGGAVTLTVGSGSGYTYQWQQNGIDITGATGSSYSAITGGSYTVHINDANNCTATSLPVTITVNSLPTATVNPLTSTTFCSGDSVILNSLTGLGYTYQWKKNGQTITGSIDSSSVSYTHLTLPTNREV